MGDAKILSATEGCLLVAENDEDGGVALDRVVALLLDGVLCRGADFFFRSIKDMSRRCVDEEHVMIRSM